MEIQTSEEAWELFQELRDKENKVGRGFNLLSKPLKDRQYYVKVLLETELNLVDRETELKVDSNLPFMSYRTGSVKEFIKELVEWVNTPRFKISLRHNRRQNNVPSSWDLSDFREKHIENVKITIGEQAKEELKKVFKFDFTTEVQRLMALQRDATDDEEIDFERFWYLINEVKSLDNMKKWERRGYSYNSDVDNSCKIGFTKQEYNKRLRELEKELKALCKKHPILRMPSIYLEEIIKKPTFDEFMTDCEDDMKENWSDMDKEDKAEHGDYDTYCENQFVCWLDHQDWDME
ncbi:hypothetical protein HQ529_03540 [Candidatus Woesearchaeota archaeon]|nr:hypothetical protein [Candidatus Woesearchaeota archaeon]